MFTLEVVYKISIHAPLRERAASLSAASFMARFQSTLPYGSDRCRCRSRWHLADFNPRSLTGASYKQTLVAYTVGISIHAPLREREPADLAAECGGIFQSTLPYGSDIISPALMQAALFQSTLPYGSEYCFSNASDYDIISIHAPLRERPRHTRRVKKLPISIHAPLRERWPW